MPLCLTRVSANITLIRLKLTIAWLDRFNFEKYLMRHYIQFFLSTFPRFTVSNVVGNFKGESSLGRRYFESTIGLYENRVLDYIRNQEKEDEYRG